MFNKERWQEIFYVLKSNKLRTFLTAFGIFWGIFMLMIMLATGNGFKNGMFRIFGDFATNSCFIWTRKTSMPYKGFNKDRRFDFEMKDIALLKERVPDIEYISPKFQWGGIQISYDNKVESFTVNGDFPQFNLIDPVTILKGRYINFGDIREKRKVLLIGDRVSQAFFKSHDEAMDKYLKINGVYLKIIGVFESKHTGNWGEGQNGSVTMPLTTMQNTFNLGNRIGYLAVTAKKGTKVSMVEEQVIAALKSIHSIHPDDERAIGHYNVEKNYEETNGLFIGINILIWIVGAGTLLAGVIGVSNIMLIVVKERTQEIGIQRAIGATPLHIISQLLLESVFLTFVAGYLGLFVGVGVAEIVQRATEGQEIEMFYKPNVDLNVALLSLLILIVSGLVAGIIPAKRAVSVKPIDAIRSEN